MSYTVTYSIHCDTCSRWTGGNSGLENATEIRREAKRRGWKVAQPGGKDTCPDCAINPHTHDTDQGDTSGEQ